jgi:hypothetical protein
LLSLKDVAVFEVGRDFELDVLRKWVIAGLKGGNV